jgi:predicted outer membrane protein
MRGHWLCGAIAVLGCAALTACAPYNYGYGRGYYGYSPYGYAPYGYNPYGAYPPPPPPQAPYDNNPNGAYPSPPPPAPYAVPPPPGPYAAPQSLSQMSNDFVQNLALNSSYEIESGRLAAQRGAAPQVRQFADRMVAGNTAVTQVLMDALQRSGTPVATPAALDQRHEAMISDLNAVQGPEFDRRYAIQQVVAHREEIALLQNYVQNGDNPVLRQIAQRTLQAALAGWQLAQTLPGAAEAPPIGPAAASYANCHKGVLWPFVREAGDCPTDAERFSRDSLFPYP